MKEKHPAWESTLKSTDTEEFLDMHFYRPIGYRWALLFRKINIRPNQVTLAAIFIGMAAGACFYFPNIRINCLGIFLLIWANSFDSADGQLARMTHQRSATGRILDGMCGDCWFIAIYLAIICRLWPEWNAWILLLALITGYFHTTQAAMADYFRNVHLLFLRGKNDSELDTSQSLTDKYRQTKQKPLPLRIVQFIYLNYTKQQESLTPRLQAMLSLIRTKYQGNAPDHFRKAYREKSLPLLPYTNLLSFNLRSIVLFISILSNYPWAYFVFELTVMNAMLYYMMHRYKTICTQLTDELERSTTD
jgi:phosphatidylglycerophosphate synthase